jgi:hypothetical protein
MNTNLNQKVYSVSGQLQAIWVESILEKAGIPVSFCVSNNDTYLDVLVANEKVFDAKNILNSERN